MSVTNKFKVLHVFTHLMAVIGLVWVIRSGQYGWLGVAFVCYLFAGVVGVNVALHRYFAHGSFKTNRLGYWFLLVSSFLPMLGSPAAWGSVHLHHHSCSDQDSDPHCPTRQGKLMTWFTAWPTMEIPLSLFRRFVKDPNIAFLNRHYFTFVIVYIFVLSMIDWRLVSFVFALPALGCFHGAAAIAVIPHVKCLGGYRSHITTDSSYNNFLAWIISLGEGWHNNHHNSPRNYRHGEQWWELDPPAFVIRHFLMTTERTVLDNEPPGLSPKQPSA